MVKIYNAATDGLVAEEGAPMKFERGLTYEIFATVVNPRDSGNIRVQIGGQDVLLASASLEKALIPSRPPAAPVAEILEVSEETGEVFPVAEPQNP